MNIFEETMKYFNLDRYKYTKSEKEELKRDVEFEKWLDAKEQEQEQKKQVEE